MPNINSIVRDIKARKKSGQKIVFTNGCFDLLHEGHRQLLIEAKKQGDLLIVGLNSDASTKRLKGQDRPIEDEATRRQALLNLEEVDEVILFVEDTPESLIRALTPDVLVKGADYLNKEVVGAKHVVAHGGRLHYASFLEGHSTTASINKILSDKK